MTFSSLIFLTAFFPVTVIVYFLLGRFHRAKNGWLIFASLVFYGWSGVQYLLIIIVSSIVNYLLGLAVRPNGWPNKAWLAAAVVFNLLILGFFKYFNFLIDNLNVISMALFGATISAPKIPLPIGISFFTFQILSYVIDVYRGNAAPQRNYFRVLLYIVFFPQLIAGPIVRYVDIEKAIAERKTTIDDFTEGAFRFVRGLCKKVLIANQLAVIADASFGNIAGCTSGTAWLGILCYTLQIYYDFSGYSDMAIGMGRIFGFRFLENFDYPYISKSIREFWRRWHISLSSWFRDYVYIPLGGNRRGTGRTYLNLLIVFFLTGLWHGAGWNFIIWGLFNGLFLVIERGKAVGRAMERIPKVIRHVYTILIVMVGWVFFQTETLADSFAYLRKMFSFQDLSIASYSELLTPVMTGVIIAAVVFSMPVLTWVKSRMREDRESNIRFAGKAILCLLGLCLCIVNAVVNKNWTRFF